MFAPLDYEKQPQGFKSYAAFFILASWSHSKITSGLNAPSGDCSGVLCNGGALPW